MFLTVNFQADCVYAPAGINELLFSFNSAMAYDFSAGVRTSIVASYCMTSTDYVLSILVVSTDRLSSCLPSMCNFPNNAMFDASLSQTFDGGTASFNYTSSWNLTALLPQLG